jgi:hypothetical protein
MPSKLNFDTETKPGPEEKARREREYAEFCERNAKRRGRGDLSWICEYTGERWTRPSDILRNPKLANPFPERRKRISK